MKGSLWGILLLTMLAASMMTRQCWAASSSEDANVQVTVQTLVEDGEKLLLAQVTDRGKPVEDVTVGFYAKRTFGQLELGEDVTLDDGTAAVAFPEGLPGDPNGRLHVYAELHAPDRYAGIRGEVIVEGAKPSQIENNAFPRALWTRHAPRPLLILILLLVGGVWVTYAYVFTQIVAIKKSGGS